MTDITVLSTADPNMVDYPYLLQAPGAGDPIEYAANDYRSLATAAFAAPGVVGNNHFTVTPGAAANTIDVTAGVGVVGGPGDAGSYVFRSTGTVNMPVYLAPGTAGVLRRHLLCAQMLDTQVAGLATAPGWQFRLIEDTTGVGDPTLTPYSIPIARVYRTGGSSVINIADLRQPAHHPMGCTLSGVAAGTGTLAASTRQPVHFTTVADDPWGMSSLTGDNMHIYIRTAGLYDIWGWVLVGVNAPVRLCMDVNAAGTDNGSLSSADVGRSMASGQPVLGSVPVASVVLGHHLAAGDKLGMHVLSTVAGPLQDAYLHVMRREVR